MHPLVPILAVREARSVRALDRLAPRSARAPRLRRAASPWLVVLLATCVTSARADDAAIEWNALANNAGGRWTYGSKPAMQGAFTLHPNAFTDAQGVQHWRASASSTAAAAMYNPAPTTKVVAGVGTLPAKSLALRSEPGRWSVVRWSAPAAGTYTVRARFLTREGGGNFSFLETAILRGDEVLFSRWRQTSRTGGLAAAVVTLDCAAGDALDFQLGPESHGAGLDATVTWEPPASADGPVMTFGPHRFAVARWPGGTFDELAFDPVHQRLASSGSLRDRCAALVSAGPQGGAGLAWDLVTSTYWQVTPGRDVRRWSADGVLLDTVFTVPLTFTVPGSGPETLESVRGIAVDSAFVYLVDAGPQPGEVHSNAWFKFTRAGAPVKSSRSTDFVANLDADPDALVDDIVWSPMTSPVFPGALLVALEHSGIQVVDREGGFVAKFRWSTQGLPPKNPQFNQYHGRLSAFAALALDPATGNLYLGDNDRGEAQAWVRLPGPGTASYAVGTSPHLEYPRPGCSLPLWEPATADAVLLGLAWRPADGMCYAVDVNGGDLWRIDPRSGHHWRLGPTGASSWGVAYAADRDILYTLFNDATNRVFALDPRTGDATPLPEPVGYFPTDLAFNASDGFLYAIDNTPPARLLRIDRDTGLAAEVGNTVNARGIGWDPGTNRLWAVRDGVSQGEIVSIDPASGASTPLTGEPGAGFRDGLAVVRASGSLTVVGVEPGGAPPGSVALQAWPNPARDGARLRFSLVAAEHVDARLYDVAGREVRRLHAGALAAGVHELAWDGRDAAGRRAAAGVYFARVEAGGTTRVARLVRVR